MKKKDIITVKIDGVRFPNKAYGFVDGEKEIVKNGVPGQIVSAQVIKKRGGNVEARLLEVTERSELERQEGCCSHYEICGGCTYQTMKRQAELDMKEQQVKTLLEDAGIHVESWEGITPSPLETGYRNKCEFSFGDEVKDGPLALGMRKKMSHYEVVTLKDCNIVDVDFVTIVQGALAFFQERNVAFYHRMRHDGSLRHLVVRKGKATGEILVHLVTTSDVPFSMEEFKNMILALPLQGELCGVLHSVNDGVADVVRSDEMTVLYGRDFFMEKLFDLEFKVSAYSFFQTNTSGAEVLYQRAREYVLGEINIGNAGETGNGNMAENTPGEENTPGSDALNGKASGGNATETHTIDLHDKVVFDLYSGTGTIAQLIAPVACKVIGVEIVEEAVEAAKENAALNGLDNCEFIAGDVLKVIDDIEEKPDYIILDPPRDGIHPKALDRIINFGVDHLVYISCKPTSLVRDLVILQERGYKLERAVAVDMFPATANCETVAKLIRVK